MDRCMNANVSRLVILDGMLNSTTWLYGAEVLPINLRSKVMGLAAASHFIVNVGSKCIHLLACLLLYPTHTGWVYLNDVIQPVP
jgi:hypothetical protein